MYKFDVLKASKNPRLEDNIQPRKLTIVVRCTLSAGRCSAKQLENAKASDSELQLGLFDQTCRPLTFRVGCTLDVVDVDVSALMDSQWLNFVLITGLVVLKNGDVSDRLLVRCGASTSNIACVDSMACLKSKSTQSVAIGGGRKSWIVELDEN